jgi:hypothetical protein
VESRSDNEDRTAGSDRHESLRFPSSMTSEVPLLAGGLINLPASSIRIQDADEDVGWSSSAAVGSGPSLKTSIADFLALCRTTVN